MQEGIEDVVFAFMRFPSGLAAHLHLSWLDPHKERRFTVVGAKRMATFDDMELERKLTIYDKGFDEKADSYGEYITRAGEIRCPRVPNAEPLRLECEHFVSCIREGDTPRSDGESGLRVVRVLEGLQRSLDGRAIAPVTAAAGVRRGSALRSEHRIQAGSRDAFSRPLRYREATGCSQSAPSPAGGGSARGSKPSGRALPAESACAIASMCWSLIT